MAASPRDGALFAKFRLRVDGASDDAAGPPKRQRKTLSCDQCHRSKVKCDRGHPCSRCVAAGREDQCSLRPAPSAQQPTHLQPPGSPHVYYTGEGAIRTGLTHWASVINELEEAREYVFDQKPEFHATFQKLTRLKDLYPSRTGHNFPFGDGVQSSPASIIAGLPARTTVQALVDVYMESFEKTHRLLHSLQFHQELSRFWSNTQDTSPAWLAQLLMMLSLGCKAAPPTMLDRLEEPIPDNLGRQCLDWAEVSLRRAPFMDFPDLAAIRALCMMAMAKSIDVEIPATSGGALEGFIVRLAMSMSLHRDPAKLPPMSVSEAEMRRRIWNTIVFLDLNAAVDSGLPALIKPTDWDTAPPANLDDVRLVDAPVRGDLHPLTRDAKTFTDSSFQITLARAYPVVSLVLSTVNSTAPDMEYDVVLDCDSRIREVLREGGGMLAAASNATANGRERTQVAMVQQTMLTVFLRRTLLALHRPYARNARSSQGVDATSHWSVLECSLALLHAQHRLHEKRNDTLPMLWFADLFQSDFAVAMLYVILGLRRRDFSDLPTGSSSEPQMPRELARETTWIALRASFDIVKAGVGRSFHLFKIFLGVALSIAALEASESGVQLHEAMERAAHSIIEVVQRSRAS